MAAGRVNLLVTLDPYHERASVVSVMQKLHSDSVPAHRSNRPRLTMRQTSRCVLGAVWLGLVVPMFACSSAPANEPSTGDEEDAPTETDEPPASDGSDSGAAPGGGRRDAAVSGGKKDAAATADARSPTLDAAVDAKPPEPSDDASTPGASVDAATDVPAPGSSLPPLTDPGAKGPFEIQVEQTLEGLSTHILIAPKELGRDGIQHPILVWINGAGTSSTSYRAMLDNVAAHGFFLLDDKQSTFEVEPEVVAQRAAIDWAIAQANKVGGPYYGKLDTTRIAIAGQSLGSVSTFGNVGDARIKTSIHIAGGLLGNPQGVDESWMKSLHAPAAFLCGDRDTNGLPRVKRDFAGAPPTVPVFFGLLAGVGHTDEFNEPNGGRWGRFMIAWLRWQLADDASFAKYFTGADCEFCKGDWMAMKRAID